MRLNFKKISAIATSTLMVGMTTGIAAAASYPAPFVESGVGDVAVVYGTGQGAADLTAATNLNTDLSGSVTSGETSIDGESVLIERTSDKFNLGDSADDVFITSLDEDDMPVFLAEGTYMDDDNTEYDFTQKITLGDNINLSHFSDSDYKDKTPTAGIKISDDLHVLNYTLDFVTHPAYNASGMETTTITMMGKDYYVLDVKGVGDASTDNKTTLLDSANSAIINEGETITVNGKEVSLSFIGASEVKFSIDGQLTNSLAEGSTYKLTDGTYIGVKDILVQDYAGGTKQVEFGIGKGKLELPDSNNIELNDETIEEIISFPIQDSSYKLDKIVLQWTTDDEAFIVDDQVLTMPGFDTITFSMTDFVRPAEESLKVDYSGSDVIELKATLEDGDVTIPILNSDANGALQLIGKDSSNRLKTVSGTSITLNETQGDKYLVASWNSPTEGESYYLKFDITSEDNVNKVRFINEVTGDEKKVANASDASFGSVVLTVNNVTKDGSKKWADVSISSGGNFNTLYTKEGLKVFLPYNETTANGNSSTGADGQLWLPGTTNSTVAPVGHNATSFYLFMDEENYLGTLAGGRNINMTITESGTSNKIHVSDINTGNSEYEIGDSDVYESIANTDLATKVLYTTGGDQDTAEVIYSGSQAYAKVYVTTPDATSTSSAGTVLLKDTETAQYSDKNVIVVGGSCINSAAAALVGGAYCGDEWTTNTGIGAGQFLIKGYASSSLTSKHAMLVAGYEAADTNTAVTYLMNNDVDTSAEYTGTTSTVTATKVA